MFRFTTRDFTQDLLKIKWFKLESQFTLSTLKIDLYQNQKT